MKNATLYILKEVIAKIKEKGSNKFKLPLILNEMSIDERIKVLEALREPSKQYDEFMKESRELVSNHCEKDEQGQIMLYSLEGGKGERRFDRGYPNIVTDIEVFENSSANLELKYKGALEKEKKKQKDFENTLQEDCDLVLKTINFEDVPEIPYDYLKLLFETGMIQE